MAEGKQHALAVGVTTLSTEEMYVNQIFILWRNSIKSFFKMQINCEQGNRSGKLSLLEWWSMDIKTNEINMLYIAVQLSV